MTNQEWLAEVERRIRISEGCEAERYFDSRGIPTIGVGFNLQRADAPIALGKCGVAEVSKVIAGDAALTPEQIEALFTYSFAPILSDARQSLADEVFDALDDARRFVICDLIYNMGAGADGWGGFSETHLLIAQAVAAKRAGDDGHAHDLFGSVAEHLAASAWYTQTGNRAKRDIAMMRSGIWCDPAGDGTL